MTSQTLGTFYYHDHFMEMLSHIADLSAGLLTAEHKAFIHDFRALDRDAQCLYIRMANRRKLAFRPDELRYDEITDTRAALQLLSERGFVRGLSRHDYLALLSAMTKAELQSLVLASSLTGVLKSWPKARVLEAIKEQLTDSQLDDAFAAEALFVQDRVCALSYLLYLYFGRPELDLKQFTMRDLGLMPVRQATGYSPRFSHQGEALTCYRLSELRRAVREDPANAARFTEVLACLPAHYPSVQGLADKTLLEFGQALEKNADTDNAMQVYQACTLAKSQERHLRLLYSCDKELTRQTLEGIIARNNNDALYHFARDFYARKFTAEKVSEQTQVLRNSDSLMLDDLHRASPEHGVLKHYTQLGWQAWFSENTLWRALFALTFWDELFEDERSVHSPFDRIPANLRDRSFTAIFAESISRKLEQLSDGQYLVPLLKTVTARHGESNGLFRWNQLQLDALKLLLSSPHCRPVAEILRLMAEDYPAMKDGYPDLMLCKDDQLRFIEVKAEGDALRANQLTRLRQLESAGFDCGLLRVTYTHDPRQVFVVVDIETTGGNQPQHRVTEIGAVKVCNGDVVERFQTLINPQRHIPSSITRLTGISDAMVSDAPVFSEIADDFRRFCGDAIFVAHNVNFDYGFIQQEYERLGQSWRMPKFCTVVNMRRYFPGQDSYKLSALCHTFEVSLDTHHRALCDAEAAAQLLLMILEKRQQEG